MLPLLLCFGCHKKSEPKNALRLNLREDLLSLDPRLVRTIKDLTLVKQLYEGLMRLNAEGTPECALAEKVELSDDLTTYTFTLRDAFWSNGDRVTAEDFLSSWRKVLDSSFPSDYANMLYPIINARLAREGKCDIASIGVAAPASHTLVVQLERPTPYFLELTAFPTYFPVHSKSEGTHFLFNGPFQVEKWELENQLILKKNPSYWDAQNVAIEELSLTVIADNNTESQLFDKGELDWLGQPLSHNISTERIKILNEKRQLFSYPIAGTYWFKFNTAKEPFTNCKMRKAFSYALNRQEIITHILQGNQNVATGPTPPSMGLHNTPYFTDGDVERAKILFEEALNEMGYTRDNLPKIVLNYPPTERNSKIVQLAQQQWRRAFDIPIFLEAVENQLYRQRVREGLFQFGTGEWVGDFNDPITFLELFQYRKEEKTGSGLNDTGWQNEQFISLLESSAVERDAHKRVELLAEAEKILVDEMPIIPLYHYAFDYAKRDNISGVILSPLGLADFKYVRKG